MATLNVEGDVSENQVLTNTAPVTTGYRGVVLGVTAPVPNTANVFAMGDLQGRSVALLNSPMLVTVPNIHGPVSLTHSAASEVTLITFAIGGFSLCITHVSAYQQGAGAINVEFRQGAGTANTRYGGTMGGGSRGIRCDFNPPWKLPAATSLVAFQSIATQVRYNVHFFIAQL